VVTERYGMTATAYDSWSVPNATHRFNIDKPTFKKQDGGLVVQHNFRLDDKLFSEAKVAVRYFQEKSDPQAEARVTLEQVD